MARWANRFKGPAISSGASLPDILPPGMLRVDHAVVLVRDLPAAVAGYRRLGFTVAEGGRHRDGPTSNALIGFADGTYLELLALTPPWLLGLVRVLHRARLLWALAATRPPVERRFLAHARGGEGLLDFGLVTDDLAADVRRARAAGLALTDPARGRRQRAEGGDISWDFALPASNALPFLLADRTPRALRVPAPAICQHANGALGIARLVLAARDVDRAAGNLRCLLGTAVRPETTGGPAVVDLHGVEIQVTGSADGADVNHHVTRHGDSLFAVDLRAGGRHRVLDPGLTHGARVTLR